MKVELVMDPSKRPLSTRLNPYVENQGYNYEENYMQVLT